MADKTKRTVPPYEKEKKRRHPPVFAGGRLFFDIYRSNIYFYLYWFYGIISNNKSGCMRKE